MTDPAISQLLYDTASSTDKTIKRYDGMWCAAPIIWRETRTRGRHAILAEPDGGAERVRDDIASWIDAHIA